MVICVNVLFTASTRYDISCPVVQREQPNINKFLSPDTAPLLKLPTFNSATPSPPSFFPVVQSLRKNTNAKPYMFPRVFGDKFGDEFGDKFGDAFCESLNLLTIMVITLVMDFVNQQIG